MFDLNRPVVNYYRAYFAYRDHGNSGLNHDERETWREARREAEKKLKAMGFKFRQDFRTEAQAQAYADKWNAEVQFDPILGKLKVETYSYL